MAKSCNPRASITNALVIETDTAVSPSTAGIVETVTRGIGATGVHCGSRRESTA